MSRLSHFISRISWFMMLGALSACQDKEPSEPADASGASGAAGGSSCALGASLPDGTCITPGVPENACGEGFVADGTQGCEPVLPEDDCPDGTMPVLGHTDCQPVGVRTGKGLVCGTGFTTDGGEGCDPVLPTEGCPAGQMAVPGETACHVPQSCGTGAWGDIPIDATTQFVDAGHAGAESDGSMGKPWPTIAEGLAHAVEGAVVAVAAGEYPENLVITRGVKLWGVCPSQVSVLGAGPTATLTVSLLPPGQSTEVHGLGIRGEADGVDVLSATGVTLAGLWIHDTGGDAAGVQILAMPDPASVVLRESLLEKNHQIALAITASIATVQRSVIRTTQPKASDMTLGAGIAVVDSAGQRGSLTLIGSLLEQNHAAGVYVAGSDATIDSTVIRDTQTQVADMRFGEGIGAIGENGLAAKLTLTGSLLDHNHSVGMYVETPYSQDQRSEAIVQRTIVRNTEPEEGVATVDGGLHALNATLTLSSVLIDGNIGTGMALASSDVTIEDTIVRNTLPTQAGQAGGRGITVETDDPAHGSFTITSSRIEQNHDVGIDIESGNVTVESTVVRNTLPLGSDGTSGQGIRVLTGQLFRGPITLRSCLLEKNHDVGLVSFDSDVTVDRSVVRDTQPRSSDGMSGAGIVMQTATGSTLGLTASILERNSAVGLLAFGANVTVKGSLIRDTLASGSDQILGRGIEVDNLTDQRASLHMSSSVLTGNRDVGLLVSGSDAIVERTVIRGTLAGPTSGTGGLGIVLASHTDEGAPVQRGSLHLVSSLLDRNVSTGLLVSSSDATVDGLLVRDTQPRPLDMLTGDGVIVQGPDGQRGQLTLMSSLLDGNRDGGLVVFDSSTDVRRSVVRHTKNELGDDGFGDGLTAVGSEVSVEMSVLDDSARASIGNFGSTVTLTRVDVRCSVLLFDQETSFTDSLGEVTQFDKADYHETETACFACDGTPLPCKAVSDHLSAPKPVPPLTPSQPLPEPPGQSSP